MISLFFLGILASVSPCPLATNIAAVGFISRHAGTRFRAATSAFAYTLGRIVAYIGLGMILFLGLSAVPSLSFWLQEKFPMFLGPLLMIAGVIFLGWISFPTMGRNPDKKLSEKLLAGTQFGGAFILGVLFALALCPPSAAIFFGSVIPATDAESYSWFFPAAFGAGTAVPVIAVSALLISGTRIAGRLLQILPQILSWIQNITGGIFLILGGYWTFTKIILTT